MHRYPAAAGGSSSGGPGGGGPPPARSSDPSFQNSSNFTFASRLVPSACRFSLVSCLSIFYPHPAFPLVSPKLICQTFILVWGVCKCRHANNLYCILSFSESEQQRFNMTVLMLSSLLN